ncbi:hypothetical protein IT402_00440 [Candidatus Nomurabacteria bacterium]|nr:hypothetical protein [Candidatus Nomurabacteria bacterium]
MINSDLTKSLKICFSLRNINLLMKQFVPKKELANFHKELNDCFPKEKDLVSKTKNILFRKEDLKILQTKTSDFANCLKKTIQNNPEQNIHLLKILYELTKQNDFLLAEIY